MIEQMSDAICKYLKRKEIIHENMELYNFGLKILIAYAIECVFVVLLSLIFDHIISGFIYIILFAKIRDYSGGYHANTYLGCITGFSIIYMILLIIKKLFPFKLLIFLFIVSLFGLIVISPVEHPNKNMEFVNKNEIKLKLCKLLVFEAVLTLFIGVFNTDIIATICLTNIIVFILAVIQKFINIERRMSNEFII